jgi:predicted RNA binding protein YcfA (HicA-like mRNA interferase family)
VVQVEKLIRKLKASPRSIREGECVRILENFGFVEKKGRSGSRRAFVRKEDGAIIHWHRPHGGKNQMRIEVVRTILQAIGLEDDTPTGDEQH